MRVGFGYDVHALARGESLILAGVQLEHDKGTVAHSDGDVLVHAVCDAMLGAANLRDIGYHFPDTDPRFKGVDSLELLKQVVLLLDENGYELGNADITLALEKPKVNPHIGKMIQKLSKVMSVESGQLSIKATTSERLGFVGREEGVACHAVVLINKK